MSKLIRKILLLFALSFTILITVVTLTVIITAVCGTEATRTIDHATGTVPVSHTYSTPVVGGVDGSPDLQVNGLRASAASRVDVPADDEAVVGDLLGRVDDQDRLLGAVLVLAPPSLVAQLRHAPA